MVRAGWFSLLGQVAITGAIAFTLLNHLAAMVLLGSGFVFTQGHLLGIYAGELPDLSLSWSSWLDKRQLDKKLSSDLPALGCSVR